MGGHAGDAHPWGLSGLLACRRVAAGRPAGRGGAGAGLVGGGVTPSNNRLHPTPGVDIGGRRSVRPARVKLGRSASY
jgi:hypothetical protein